MTREIIRRNLDIRSAAKSAGVFLYEIAEKLGVSEPTFNRYLRKELSEGLIHRLRHNLPIDTKTLDKLCKALDCYSIFDVIEYKRD